MWDPSTGKWWVVDWDGFDIVEASNSTTASSAVIRRPQMGTPGYQPYSLYTGHSGYSHLLDVYALGLILVRLLAGPGEVYLDNRVGGETAIRSSNMGNKITLAGLGTLPGGKGHNKLMRLEEKERDWVWRKDGRSTSCPWPGRSIATKLLGIHEVNRKTDLQSLQPSELRLEFPLDTVHGGFAKGDVKSAAEALMKALVYGCCSLKEKKRLKGLKCAVLAAYALVLCLASPPEAHPY